MNYREYIKASNRHLVTCNRLLELVETYKKDTNIHHYINEVYYLSGYVYECLLSYILFYDYKDDVEKNPLYSDKFLTHHLPSKVKHVKEEGKKDIPLIAPLTVASPNKEINKLFSDWSVSARYEPNKSVNFDNLKSYISLMKSVTSTILRQYPLC